MSRVLKGCQEMNEQAKVSKNSVTLIVVAVAAAVGATVASRGVQSFFGSTQDVDSQLRAAAEEVNKNLPMMVDSITRLDTTSALPDRKFVYKYTILNVESLPGPEEFEEQIKPSLVNMYRTSKDMEVMRKAKATLVYTYFTKEGKEFCRIEIPAPAI